MTKEEVLVVRPPYRVSSKFAKDMHEQLVKQKESGVVIIPHGWSVVIAPKNLEIGVAVDRELVPGVTTIDIQEYQGETEKPEDISTPWEFVENEMYSPFDGSKEKNLICSECRRKITRWNEDMVYCHYCGKRHYFNKQEDKKEDKEEEIWCTECPYFKDIVDDDHDWFGALCTKDGHESSPSMYAIQSLHNDCPLKRKEGE